MAEPELDADTRLVRRREVIGERVLDETVVLDPESDAYARLNASGGWLWEQLGVAQTVGALAQALAAEYGIDRQRAQADVTAFARGLLERGLIETT